MNNGEDSLTEPGSSLPAVKPASPQLVDITTDIKEACQQSDPTVQKEDSFAPELMLQCRDCQVYVSSTVTESTLATVMRVIRNA